MPFATQEIYAAAHKGRLYVAGGIAARVGVPYFTSRVVSYDPVDDGWREEPELPEPLHHVALVSTGEDLLAVGGFNGGYTHVWRMRDSVYKLTPDGWMSVGNLPQPQAEGVVATSRNGRVHLVGGQSPKGEANSVRSDHAEVHDHWMLEDGGWRDVQPIPTARNSATGGWLGDQLVVAGGRTSAGNLATTEIYDARIDAWHEGAPMPQPQAGTASVVIGNDLLVFGGEIFLPEANVFAEVWRYSLVHDQWTPLPSLPTPRHGLGAGLIGGGVYVVGGATKPGGRGTSDLNEVLVMP